MPLVELESGHLEQFEFSVCHRKTVTKKKQYLGLEVLLGLIFFLFCFN